jgi:hypothetical protein
MKNLCFVSWPFSNILAPFYNFQFVLCQIKSMFIFHAVFHATNAMLGVVGNETQVLYLVLLELSQL